MHIPNYQTFFLHLPPRWFHFSVSSLEDTHSIFDSIGKVEMKNKWLTGTTEEMVVEWSPGCHLKWFLTGLSSSQAQAEWSGFLRALPSSVPCMCFSHKLQTMGQGLMLNAEIKTRLYSIYHKYLLSCENVWKVYVASF